VTASAAESAASAAESSADRPVGWRRSMALAASEGLGRPRLWPLGLASFLLRGGLVVYLLPIVVVPSTVGVATWVGPSAITAAGPSDRFIAAVVAAALLAVLWFVLGGLVAAAAEAALIQQTLETDEGGAPADASRAWLPGANAPSNAPSIDAGLCLRLLLVRLIAAIPLVVALAWGLGRIVSAGYAELTTPGDTATPLPVRVLLDVPEVIVAVLATWLLAETVAGIAARRIVLFGDRVPAAAAGMAVQVARHPLATLGTVAVTILSALALVVPGLVSSAIAWDRLGDAIVADAGPLPIVVLTVLFVAIWVSGLALAGAAAAWRSVAWTLEVLRVSNGPG
jgi:hypothetical protein